METETNLNEFGNTEIYSETTDQSILVKEECATEIEDKIYSTFDINGDANESNQLSTSEVNVNERRQDPKSPFLTNQKKRGRKSKEFLALLKPTRASTRKKKCPDVMSYDTDSKMRCQWTYNEKVQFLKGLEEFGPDNISGLKSYVPNKSDNEIKNQIRMWKDFARSDLEKKLVLNKKKMNSATSNCVIKLNEWMEYFNELADVSPTKLYALSNVFLLISEYGTFPLPSESNGIDYRAMYRYIHCTLNGTPYYGVNPVTAEILNQVVGEMFAMFRDQNRVLDLKRHMYSPAIQPKKKTGRTYSRSAEGDINRKLNNFESILKRQDMNPLNIPREILKKPTLIDMNKVEDEEVL